MRTLYRFGQRAVCAASLLSLWALAAMAQTAPPAGAPAAAPAAKS